MLNKRISGPAKRETRLRSSEVLSTYVPRDVWMSPTMERQRVITLGKVFGKNSDTDLGQRVGQTTVTQRNCE